MMPSYEGLATDRHPAWGLPAYVQTREIWMKWIDEVFP